MLTVSFLILIVILVGMYIMAVFDLPSDEESKFMVLSMIYVLYIIWLCLLGLGLAGLSQSSA